jgi:hypothetical protein
MQVADKDAARVLVEMHNRGLLSVGLVMVGTLAFMAWLNELGVKAVALPVRKTSTWPGGRSSSSRPPYRSLRRWRPPRWASLPFRACLGQPLRHQAKRPGKDGLRVDVLTSGTEPGKVVPVPELGWHARAIPHFDYLLASPRNVAMLAGGHCVPVAAPAPERLAWHKLYSSTRRVHDAAKAEKDLRQAATLLAVLVERDNLGAGGNCSGRAAGGARRSTPASAVPCAACWHLTLRRSMKWRMCWPRREAFADRPTACVDNKRWCAKHPAGCWAPGTTLVSRCSPADAPSAAVSDDGVVLQARKAALDCSRVRSTRLSCLGFACAFGAEPTPGTLRCPVQFKFQIFGGRHSSVTATMASDVFRARSRSAAIRLARRESICWAMSRANSSGKLRADHAP